MHTPEFLRELLILTGAAVVVVATLHRFRVPNIAGFLLAGALIGPRGLALVEDTAEVEQLAEFGVALLLFGIGLEFPLARLRRLWRPVLFGGGLQVGLTGGIATLAAWILGARAGEAAFLGCAITVSSTAIVLRGLEERSELETPHGRFTLGVLLFQDLCVLPMMMAVPFLSPDSSDAGSVGLALARAAVVLAGVLWLGRYAVTKVLHLVALTRQRNLFVLTVLLLCLGTAWLVSQAGISLVLGAFLAGLVVAGSEYRRQALADLIPFKEVFTSFFFVSVGMLLDVGAVAAGPLPVLSLLAAILAGKFLLAFAAAALLRLPVRVCVLSAASLAQVGEFSFILAQEAERWQVVGGELGDHLRAATILSMLVTPFAIALAPHLAAGAGRLIALGPFLEVEPAREARQRAGELEDHVIIAGYGLAGSELAESLQEQGADFLIVDLNPENVRTATEAGFRAYFGDATSDDVLRDLGAAHARQLVIVVSSQAAAEGAARAARRVNRLLPVLARARFVEDRARLERAGATQVLVMDEEIARDIVAAVTSDRG